LYSSKPSYVFGFHGLDETIGKQVLNGETELRHSRNSYDWLGHGVYFWENSLERARQYAIEDSQRKDSKIEKPFVLGAIIDLGNCLDLLDKRCLDFLLLAYQELKLGLEENGNELPVNSSFGVNDFDFKKRELDCTVIRYAVELAKAEGNSFDSVRAAFWEGEALYPNAGLKTHNHIQLSVMNPNCIKGIFLPRDLINFQLGKMSGTK
jgi:hypothetical protein